MPLSARLGFFDGGVYTGGGGGGGSAATIENGAGDGEASNSDTVSCTVTAGNRACVVVASESTATHDAVSRDGQSFAQVGATITHTGSGDTVRVSIWELASPHTGSHDVTVTTSTGTDRIGVVAYSLVGAGAAQATTGSDTGTTSPRETTFTVADDDSLVIDGLAAGNYNESLAANSPQVAHADFTSGGSSTANRCRVGSSSRTANAGSVTTGWVATDGTFTLRSAYLAVAFPPL